MRNTKPGQVTADAMPRGQDESRLEAVRRSRECFGCGTDNPAGLDVGFVWDGERAICEYTPPPRHRGYGAVVHGGIGCTLLDEVMCIGIGKRVGGKLVTVSIEVEFMRPIWVGKPVRAEGWHTRTRGRFHFGRGQVTELESGKICAVARMKGITLPQEKAQSFINRR